MNKTRPNSEPGKNAVLPNVVLPCPAIFLSETTPPHGKVRGQGFPVFVWNVLTNQLSYIDSHLFILAEESARDRNARSLDYRRW